MRGPTICYGCGRPLPGRRYKPDGTDVGVGVLLGLLGFFVAMGAGVNLWLSAAVLMVLTLVGFGLSVKHEEKARKQRDGE